MALKKCEDCGREISSEAPACPGCGRPNHGSQGAGAVPASIQFDDSLLLTPTFEEVGLPQQLGMLGVLSPQVKIGQWISRGDEILKARYAAYKWPTKPFWGFLSDPLWTMEHSLKSPVSGLVLGFRKEIVSCPSDWGTTYYSSESVLPVLLLPRDEPQQYRWELSFFEWIGAQLRHHWSTLPFCHHEKGHVRLGQILPELKDPEWKPALSEIANFKELNIKEFPVRKITPKDWELVSSVQSLRAHDLLLRDKLVHLTRLSEEQ